MTNAESKSNVVPLKTPFRHYKIARVRGQLQVVRFNGETHEIDRTCASINEMLRDRLVDIPTVRDWIELSQEE